MVFLSSSKTIFAGFLALGAGLLQANAAFDNSRSDNLAVYFGQGTGTLASFCQDDTIDVIPLAFLFKFFSTGGMPQIDFAGLCSSDTDPFPGTQLANCQSTSLADDIKTCQANGKIVTLSLGGGTGDVGFSSDSQAEQFADTIWNSFLGGTSDTRPFGSAVLDGIDLDIESGTTDSYAAFINALQAKASAAGKKVWVTAAPQCVFPDAHLTEVLNAVAFDAIYVQYNNDCGLQTYGTDSWNFGTWDNWAKTTAVNKAVKVYIGAPASSDAAGSGYVSADKLSQIASATAAQYSSFGGVMLWDASSAASNNNYDKAIKTALTAAGGGGSGTSSTTSSTPGPTSTSSSTPRSTSTPAPAGSGTCTGVDAWSATTAMLLMVGFGLMVDLASQVACCAAAARLLNLHMYKRGLGASVTTGTPRGWRLARDVTDPEDSYVSATYAFI
ncbi:hypothetical protein H0H92_011339 [Tricholoma furcatifolium]|nr:hypothetical protein H0H92_011339 [Tricholoma furcatifolium]